MELLILRHAQAVDIGAEGVSSDADRLLTDQGKADMDRLGRVLVKLDALPDKILSSPFTRAQQSATTLLTASGCDAPIELTPGLRPGATDMGIVGLVKNRAKDADRVMIVGHMPDLGKFLGSLIAPQGLQARITPGTAVLVNVGQPEANFTGELLWFLTPESLGRILET